MRRCDEIRSPAPSRLSRTQRASIYAIGIGIWLTGVLWLLFHYFVVYPGRFGPTTSPLEPWWLALHGAFAFTVIWIFGLLWGVHVPAGWSRGRRRPSGGVLAGLLGWLIVSGYLLYYAGGEEFRAGVSLAHWIIGLAAPIAFLAHRLNRHRRLSATALPLATSKPALVSGVPARLRLVIDRPAAYVSNLIRRSVSACPRGPEIAPAADD